MWTKADGPIRDIQDIGGRKSISPNTTFDLTEIANKAAVCSELCDSRKQTLFIAIFYVWFTLGFKGQSVVGLHAGELTSANNQRPPNYR